MASKEDIKKLQEAMNNTPKFVRPVGTKEEEDARAYEDQQIRQRSKYRMSLPFEERQQFDRMEIERRNLKTKTDEEWAAGASERNQKERNELRLRKENPFYDYDQSAVGIESNINRKNLEQDIEDARKEIGRFARFSPEDKEAIRNYENLRDSLNIFDAQLNESRQSWQKKNWLQNQPQMQTPDSNKVGKYHGMTKDQIRNADLIERGYRDRSGATIPYADRNQGKPGQVQRSMGQQQQSMQNPAMAQRKQWRPYDLRTGQSLSDTQLDKIYRNEASRLKRAGGEINPRTIAQNPYLKESPYDKSQQDMKFEMANFRNPKAINNYYQNRNF